jgi:hypothetical protein
MKGNFDITEFIYKNRRINLLNEIRVTPASPSLDEYLAYSNKGDSFTTSNGLVRLKLVNIPLNFNSFTIPEYGKIPAKIFKVEYLDDSLNRFDNRHFLRPLGKNTYILEIETDADYQSLVYFINLVEKLPQA